jgi:hypothetical protein
MVLDFDKYKAQQFSPRLRLIEDELPDVSLPETAAAD